MPQKWSYTSLPPKWTYLQNHANTVVLQNYATQVDLRNHATQVDLRDHATQVDLRKHATKWTYGNMPPSGLTMPPRWTYRTMPPDKVMAFDTGGHPVNQDPRSGTTALRESSRELHPYTKAILEQFQQWLFYAEGHPVPKSQERIREIQ